MNLLWHLMAKDFRRLRGPIALWLAVLGAKVAHGFALIAGDAPGRLMANANNAASVLVACDVALVVLLMALLVQEDPPMEAEAFWRTRAIAAGRLLAAKGLAALGLFAVVPVAMWLPWWWHCGYTAGQMAQAAAETVGWQILVLAPAAMVAALTDSLGRFFVWLLVLVAGALTAMVMATQFTGGRSGGGRETSLVVASGVFLVGCAVVTVHAYLGRRMGRSLALQGGVAGVTLAVLIAWPWDWMGKGQRVSIDRLVDRQPEQAAGAKLSLVRVSRGEKLRSGSEGERVRVGIELWLAGLPEELQARGLLARSGWRWADGREAGFRGDGWLNGGDRPDVVVRKAMRLPEEKLDEETRLWMLRGRQETPAAAGAEAEGAARGVTFRADDILTPSVVARMEREAVNFKLTAKFQLVRGTVWSESGMVAGGLVTANGWGVRFASVVRRNEQEFSVRRVETEPLVAGRLFPMPGGEPWGQGRWVCAIVNRERGVVDWLAGGDRSSSVSVRVGTVGIQWLADTVAVRRKVVRNGRWVPDETNWLEGARLVVVGLDEVGRFTRTVEARELRLEPQR